MKTIITTAISGCGEKDALNRLAEYSASKGKRVKVYHVGPMMFEQATRISLKLKPENILNLDKDLRAALRLGALDRICWEIYEGKYRDYDAAVINVHGVFFWEDGFQWAYDPSLNDFKTDLFATFIDDFRHIRKRLEDRPQWRDQELTDKDILIWQNAEVGVTTSLAKEKKKPFFAVPSGISAPTLYKLVFHPEIEPVYLSMPISHFREPEQRQVIDRFAAKLDRFFAVFDPRSVEILGVVFMKQDGKRKKARKDLVVFRHLVSRDEEWFLGQADKLIAYWPKFAAPPLLRKHGEFAKQWPKVVASPGMDHETHDAFRKTKDVWTVFLGKEASPFVIRYSTKIFYSEDDFFYFLGKRYPERKNLVW